MGRSGRSFIPVVMSLCLAPAAAAQPYWAVEDGAVLSREDCAITVNVHADGVWHTVDRGNCTEWHHYVIAADGDVGLAGVSNFCDGNIDLDGYTLDPPLTLVDLPLTTGKTWSQFATLDPMYGWNEGSAFVDGTVLGPTQVTVPAGTFDVVAVEVLILMIGWEPTLETRILLLHANLGDATGLVSWQGVVPDASSTWSDLKSLYR